MKGQCKDNPFERTLTQRQIALDLEFHSLQKYEKDMSLTP